jgi:hypothetical protein
MGTRCDFVVERLDHIRLASKDYFGHRIPLNHIVIEDEAEENNIRTWMK